MLHVIPALPGVRARMMQEAPARMKVPPTPRLAERHANFMQGLTLSKPHHVIHPTDTALSAAFHAVIFFLVLQAAAATAQVVQQVQVVEDLVFFAPALEGIRKPPEPVQRPGAPGARGGGGTKGVAVTRGFQTVAVVRTVTSEIPPITAQDRLFDARNYSGYGEEGGVADGIKGGIRVTEVPEVLAGELPVEGDGTGAGRVVEAALVSVAARLVRMTPPEYPAMLRKVGVEGSVRVRFIIDTLGMVEAASFTVVDGGGHRLFEEAVQESLLKARFTPALVGTEKVRQMTEQRFNFRLD